MSPRGTALASLSRQASGGLLRPDIIAKGILHVDEAEVTALGDLVDSLKVLIRQVDELVVGLHTAGVGALGQDDVAAAQTPGDQDLGQGVAALIGDVVQGGVLRDTLTGGRHLVLRAQGRVGGGHDALGEAVLDELVVGQEGVDLDLVEDGLDLGEGEELFGVVDGPVGHTNSASLALFIELLHCSPCRLGVVGQLLEDDVLSSRQSCLLTTLSGTYLAIGTELGLLLGLLLGSNRPVNEVEIDVFKTQTSQGVVAGPQDILVTVKVVPDLGGDEQVLSLDGGILLQELLDALPDLVLVEVVPGTVQMPVACTEGVEDSSVGLALGALTGESTETHTGDGDTVAQLEGDSARHDV